MTEPVPLSHTRAFELLPWLINGTLEGGEREAQAICPHGEHPPVILPACGNAAG